MENARRLPVGEVDDEVASSLDALAREGARRMIAAALEAEVADYIDLARVEPATGERRKFSSRILPAYARRSPKVTEVLPVLYLHGLSTGDFEPALRELLGEDASGLSPTSITRLTKAWQAEHEQFRARSLRFHRYA